MARPRNADGQRTRQAILDAALELFAQNGYFGTSLRDVAGAVGVRESALYNYFAGKDALFTAIIDADQQTKLERLSAFTDAPITDARALLEQIALSTLASFAEPRQQQLFRILMSDGIRLAADGRINLYERLGHGLEKFDALMRRLIADGWLRAGDPGMLTIAFTAPLVLWRQLHAIDAQLPIIQDQRAFVRHHVDLFLQGAAAPTARTAGPRPHAARPRAAKSSHRLSSRRQSL